MLIFFPGNIFKLLYLGKVLPLLLWELVKGFFTTTHQNYLNLKLILKTPLLSDVLNICIVLQNSKYWLSRTLNIKKTQNIL